MKSPVVAIALLSAAAAGAAGLGYWLIGGDEPTSPAPAAAGACPPGAEECFPDVEMEDRGGRAWDLAALEDQVVIVNFWATWCRPCVEEVPELAEVHDDYADEDVAVLGIMTDRPTDEEFDDFVRRTGLNYPVVPADTDLLRAFELPDVLPTTHIYDRAGRRALRHRGVLTADQVSSVIDDLLSEDGVGGDRGFE